jgi:hypothetical protein
MSVAARKLALVVGEAPASAEDFERLTAELPHD